MYTNFLIKQTKTNRNRIVIWTLKHPARAHVLDDDVRLRV